MDLIDLIVKGQVFLCRWTEHTSALVQLIFVFLLDLKRIFI